MIIRPIVCRRFIGRTDELAYLHERRREAGLSHGGLVLVSGEAGVGKTRLLSEFASSLAKSRWRIGIGRCLEFAQRPYGPILEVLSRFDAQSGELAPAASKQEQFEAIFSAFEAVAARGAIVAVIEDIHWADAATIELLAYIGAKVGSLRMLIVVTFRPEEFHAEHPSFVGLAKLARTGRAGRIDLPPLTGPELRLFISEALSGIELPNDMRRAVARASDGNPFFVEELLKSAVEHASSTGTTTAHALPTTVRATLMERLRPLTGDERRVLGQAAVIGRHFDVPLLAATLGADPVSLVPALRRAREMQLIEEESPAEFRFRHALTREAIYGDFLAVQLRSLHRTIATVLETAAPEHRSIERLAYHWWAAGDAERAAEYNELAGDAAGRVHAHEDAIALYDRAVEATPVVSLRSGSILEKIGDRNVALGLHDAALEAYAAAASVFETIGERDREANCRVRAAVQAYSLGRADPTAPLEAMLDRLDPADYLTRSRIHLGIAWITVTFYRPTEASRHIDQVDARALDAAPDIRQRFHNVRAWLFMVMGETECFREEHGAWLAAARAAGGVGLVAPVHYNGAYCYSLLGRHDEALRNVEDALRIARAEKSRHAEAGAHAMGAFARLLTGDLAGTRTEVDALRAQPTDNQVVTAHGAAWGTLAGAHLGDERLIEYWFDRLEATTSPFAAFLCGAGYAEIMVRRGRLEDARNLLSRTIDLGERPRGTVLTLLAVARYGADEDLARARAALAASAHAPGEPIERYAVELFDAFVSRRHGRHDDAARSGALAADGFGQLGCALLEAAAREMSREREIALDIYRRCGAAYDVQRLAGSSSADTAADAVGKAPGDPLSPREREIASRVARGGSNLEIAHELAISHKTVEKHLGSVYHKLGFSSRAKLAAYVAGGDRRDER